MDKTLFDYKRIADGYAKDRPYLHPQVMEMLKKELQLQKNFNNGLDVGCGTGLSTKALKMICDHVTGLDVSEEMIKIAKAVYSSSEYTFYQSKAEEAKGEFNTYDIITVAGVINWIDEKLFLNRLNDILINNGILLIYDFWISDKMIGISAYNEWWNKQYLKLFPRPTRKENVWKSEDVESYNFKLLNQVNYTRTYDMDKNTFVRFMLTQSNVIAKVEKEGKSLNEVRKWFEQSLIPVFNNKKQTLIFEGYNWYLQLIKSKKST